MSMLLLGYRHVSAPLVKLQKTLKESLEQPWLGSIQYSPAEGDRDTKQGERNVNKSLVMTWLCITMICLIRIFHFLIKKNKFSSLCNGNSVICCC